MALAETHSRLHAHRRSLQHQQHQQQRQQQHQQQRQELQTLLLAQMKPHLLAPHLEEHSAAGPAYRSPAAQLAAQAATQPGLGVRQPTRDASREEGRQRPAMQATTPCCTFDLQWGSIRICERDFDRNAHTIVNTQRQRSWNTHFKVCGHLATFTQMMKVGMSEHVKENVRPETLLQQRLVGK